jgi:hypothetical protein
MWTKVPFPLVSGFVQQLGVPKRRIAWSGLGIRGSSTTWAAWGLPRAHSNSDNLEENIVSVGGKDTQLAPSSHYGFRHLIVSRMVAG